MTCSTWPTPSYCIAHSQQCFFYKSFVFSKKFIGKQLLNKMGLCITSPYNISSVNYIKTNLIAKERFYMKEGMQIFLKFMLLRILLLTINCFAGGIHSVQSDLQSPVPIC